MTRVIVHGRDEETGASHGGRWDIWVSRRADGSFSVGATQVAATPPAAKVRTRTRLRSAAKVVAALEAVIAESGYDIAPDAEVFEEIVQALTGFDPVLAWGVGVAALGPDYVLPYVLPMPPAPDEGSGRGSTSPDKPGLAGPPKTCGA